MPLLLLAFIVVPLVELAVIGRVSDWLGLPWTLALLLVDSLVGAVVVRSEGRRTWRAFRDALSQGRWPGDEVVQGGLVLVGGALLVTPGFVTDVVGLAAVLPPTRRILSRLVRHRLTPAPLRLFRTGGGTGTGTGSGPGARPGSDRTRSTGRPAGGPDRDVLDVEVVSVERDRPEQGPPGSRGALDEPKG